MRLILVRHAEAVDAQTSDDAADAVRKLTPRGQQQAKKLCEALKRLNISLDRILTSPAVRCRETADALQSLLSSGVEITVTERLSVDQLRPKKISKEIDETKANTVVVVGHMPDIGRYATWLLDDSERPFWFAKGGAACIDVEEKEIEKATGVLEWFVTPEWY